MNDVWDVQWRRDTYGGDLATASDNDLAQELAGGNHEALAILIDRYQRLVFTIAFRIVHDKGEAQDLVQDIFLLLFSCGVPTPVASTGETTLSAEDSILLWSWTKPAPWQFRVLICLTGH